MQRPSIPELDDLDALVVQLDEARSEVEFLQEAINGMVKQIADTFSASEQRIAIIRYLYWGVPDIKVPAIAEAFFQKRNNHRVREIAGVSDYSIPCKFCGQAIYISSRNQLELAKTKQYTCDSCEEDRRKASSHHWEMERVKQEQRRAEILAMPYSEYRDSPEWDKQRHYYYYFRNSIGACHICLADDELEVYHRNDDHRGHEKPADLIVLCPQCYIEMRDKKQILTI